MKRLKKFVLILAIFLSAGFLCACGEVRVSEDLASMSSQMVYN